MDLEQARQSLIHRRGEGIRIAIIDSGVELSHPDLAGFELGDDVHIVADDLEVQAKPGNGSDFCGHGTAIASIIRTIAPAAKIGSFQVLNEQLSSRSAIIREGVRQALDAGYHILNCSFGCGVQDHIFQYKDWIDEAYLNGVHLIAACNNFSFHRTEWPGHFSSAITVNMAATDRNEEFFYRPGTLVEFAARGVDVELPWKGGGRKRVSGSSYAAPVVAALLARILETQPGLSPSAAKGVLRSLAQTWTPEIAAANEAIR